MSDATNVSDDAQAQPLWRRALTAFSVEVVGIHPRLHLYAVLASLLPVRSGGEVRAGLLSKLGFEVGAGTRVNGALRITGPRHLVSKLTIGAGSTIEPDCMLDLSDTLTIGDRVTLEPGVMILTSTHELDVAKHRAGNVITSPVSVGDGAWLGARSVILPGVKIGAGAVVEVGSVVNKDVECDTRVGGIPAVKLAALEPK